jgi:crotonobetainyl-CoA:carnitine CoA-transferase CaiB-like acyl-CoA transferase
MAGPLAGIRVIEVAQVISGPLCAMLLGEQGADVVKVEQPGGDPTRNSGDRRGDMGVVFFNCNRGKRSVVLDLTTEAGRGLLFELVRGADVFIQNFRPGKAAKLGIGPEVVCELNPSIVYATITGFGDSGPLVHRPVYDFVVQAMIGVADVQRDRASGRPQLMRTYIVDKATAYTAAQAITAALFARERDPQRRGQQLHVTMLDAGLGFFWPDGMMTHTYLERDDGAEPIAGNTDFVDAYPTSDGAIALLPTIASFFPNLCRACGHPEWVTDARFADLPTRRRHFGDLADSVADALAGLTTAEAMARFEAEDVPAAAVVDRDEVHLQPQVAHNGSLIEVDMAPVGRVRVPAHAPRFARTPAITAHDAPLAGQHTVEVLRTLGLDDAAIDALVEARVVTRPD